MCFALGEAYAVAAGHSVIISGLMIVAALVLSVLTDRAGSAMFFYNRLLHKSEPEHRNLTSEYSFSVKRMSVISIFALVMLTGYMNVISADTQRIRADKLTSQAAIIMECEVRDIREAARGYQVYVRECGINIYNGRLKGIIYMQETSDIRLGQRLLVRGSFEKPERASNPGEFDAWTYYSNKGIYMICRECVVTDKSSDYNMIRQLLYQFRVNAGKLLDTYFGERDASVLRAMLLGEKSGIDKDTKRLFQMNGIAHILAISGVHIAIIGMTLFKMLKKMTGSTALSGISSVGVIILYGMMTGLASSTFRAVIMMIITIAARIRGRSPDTLTSAGIACVIQAAVDPYIVMDAGFQLSFAAIFGIAVIAPLLEEILLPYDEKEKRDEKKCHNGNTEEKKRGKLKRRLNKIFSALLMNVSVTLVTTPLIIYYFYQFPLYSVVLNMLIVPLVSALLFSSIGVIAMGMISGYIKYAAMPAEWIAIPVKSILWIYRWLCGIVSRLPWYSVNVGHISVEMIAVFYVVMIVALYLLKSAVKQPGSRSWRGIVAAVICIVIGTGYEYVSYDKCFRVVYMDVGQGDGILIKSGMGTNIMIDGGSSDNSQVGEYVISPVLKYYGASHIAYAFITHADNDHISGLKYLLQTENTGIEIDNIVLPLYGAEDSFDEIKGLAERAGINILYMTGGDGIIISGTDIFGGISAKTGRDTAKISLSFLYPGPETGIKDVNDLSAVIRLDYHSYRMLFTGDLGETGEKQLLSGGADVKADVLKVAHHGSRYSSSDEFLKAVDPYAAIISAGADNSYGHPHNETLERLEAHGAGVFCTIESGAVSVVADRGGLRLEQYR